MTVLASNIISMVVTYNVMHVLSCVVSKNYLACVGSSTCISKGTHAIKGFVEHTTTGCYRIAVQQ